MAEREKSKYQMPDILTQEDMKSYGYTWKGMLPLSKEKALELHENKLLIFRLYEDDSEGEVNGEEDILSFDGMFGVEKDDWDYFTAHPEAYEVRSGIKNF